MIALWCLKSLGEVPGARINSAPSALLAGSVPWLSVIAGSILPGLVFITSAPVIPPLGFLVFISWRQLRPGLLPMWAGLPLGLIDDLYSGQPFGSAILLWSIAAILLDLVDNRMPWRNSALEWLFGAATIAAYIGLALPIANAAGSATSPLVIVPQMVVSILLYPMVGRMLALLDRLRLLPIVNVK